MEAAVNAGRVDLVRLMKYAWDLMREVVDGRLWFEAALQRVAERAAVFLRPVRSRLPAVAPTCKASVE